MRVNSEFNKSEVTTKLIKQEGDCLHTAELLETKRRIPVQRFVMRQRTTGRHLVYL